ncbi:MAG: hypothetical protein LBG57_02650 [Treponema sp.]|nr:hypothetical protein [Treponema sp.]
MMKNRTLLVLKAPVILLMAALAFSGFAGCVSDPSLEGLVAHVKQKRIEEEEQAEWEREAAAQREAEEQERLEREAAAQREAEEKAAAEAAKKEEQERLARERAQMAPRWNDEDFGPGAAIAGTFDVANAEQWEKALKAIDTGGDNRNYVINVTGNFSGGISFTRVHRKVAVSLRSGGAGEHTLAGSFTVGGGETLILRDMVLEGGTVSEGGTLVMKGGKSNRISVGGTFTMSGGEISGNTGYGDGVDVSGTFTMSGGTIYGSDAGDKANKSERDGAALYVGNRDKVKYGNGALILEGYRVNYTNDTLTGKK